MEIVTLTCAAALLALAPSTTLLSGDGAALTADAACERLAHADVIFVGEVHTDTVAHAVEAAILSGQVAHARDGGRPVALALEMLEADVQPVVDEYLAGLVSEGDYLKAIRPWARYATDYHPTVGLARDTGTPVVATNAPERHVRMVARDGIESLWRLPDTWRALYGWAIPPPSSAYAAQFAETMAGMHGGPMPSVDGLLAAQNLRDATMARRIAETLDAGLRVVHVNGSFHSAGGLGIPEHLARLRPEARIAVVTVRPIGLDARPEPSPDDIVILTPRADA